MPNAVIAHAPDGNFDLEALERKAPRAGRASKASTSCRMVPAPDAITWDETPWVWDRGLWPPGQRREFHVVAIDYGIKRNILRLLADQGCRSRSCRRRRTAEDILAHKPDGVFLSNGPAIRRRPANMPCR
jgi:carbamoyl-phosphate synthase small subunit